MLKDEPKYGLCRWSGGGGMWYGLGFTRCLVPGRGPGPVPGIEVVAASSLGETVRVAIEAGGKRREG